MNAAQLHLAMNHLPVVVPLIAVPLLAVGLWRGSREIRAVGLWLLVLAALAAIPVYLTGDPSQKVVMNYPGVSRLAIHRHEDAALIGLIWLEIVGATSLLVGLASRRGKEVPRWAWGFLLLLGIGSVGWMLNTAHLGGEIRHEEIQSEPFIQSAVTPILTTTLS